jgi:hypothetical protein
MPAHTTAVKYHRDGTHFIVRREPWWTYLLSNVIIHGLVEFLCFLTGHRFCNCSLMIWAIRLSDRHTVEFEIPVDEELARAYECWRGWRHEDDDTSDED